MFKRLITASIIFATGLSSAYGLWGSAYLAPMVVYDSITAGSNIRYEGVSPRLALGYGGIVTPTYPVYLGAEVFGSPKSITIHNHKDGTPGLKTAYVLGISIIPGIYLDDIVMAYLRLSASDASFDNLNTSRWGFQAGVGLQANLSGCWDIRGEYDYTTYSSIDDLGSIKSSMFALGVLYRFG